MTRGEAIELLFELLEDIKFSSSDYPQDVEALEMAIEALKQPIVVRCKNCIFSDKTTTPYYCRAIHLTRDPCDYCSRGRL